VRIPRLELLLDRVGERRVNAVVFIFVSAIHQNDAADIRRVRSREQPDDISAK
jgi:hypothetical protein